MWCIQTVTRIKPKMPALMAGAVTLSFAFIAPTAVIAQNNEVNVESRVTGNQEQPNVLSIVPWKQADDFQIIEQGFDEQFDRLFPHLEPTEFERRRYFAKELDEETTP